MKISFLTLSFLLSTNFIFSQGQHYKLLNKVKQTYVLGGVKKTAEFTEINKSTVVRLNEPLKALAAYYASVASTDFSDDGNNLIVELGLGKQGSDLHKAMIKKWYKNDASAKRLRNNKLLLSAPGSSNFSVFEKLDFKQVKDTILISYEVLHYHHGKGLIRKGLDKAIISKDEIIWLKQDIFSTNK